MYLITWITHLPTPEGWMDELAMLADRLSTFSSDTPLPISSCKTVVNNMTYNK